MSFSAQLVRVLAGDRLALATPASPPSLDADDCVDGFATMMHLCGRIRAGISLGGSSALLASKAGSCTCTKKRFGRALALPRRARGRPSGLQVTDTAGAGWANGSRHCDPARPALQNPQEFVDSIDLAGLERVTMMSDEECSVPNSCKVRVHGRLCRARKDRVAFVVSVTSNRAATARRGGWGPAVSRSRPGRPCSTFSRRPRPSGSSGPMR